MEKNIHIVNAEIMAMNYKKLFLIEQYLKENIEINEHEAELYFHEYIPRLNKDIYPEELRKKLYRLVKVRNKICHMKELDFEEVNFLNDCYDNIFEET